VPQCYSYGVTHDRLGKGNCLFFPFFHGWYVSPTTSLSFTDVRLEKPISVVPLLSRALHRIRTTPPRIIASPPTRAFSDFSASSLPFIARFQSHAEPLCR
jgi:hypothetical protein